jgi:hypothetical protein
MTKRVTVHLSDGTEDVHNYPFETSFRDGVVVIWTTQDHSVKYPLTSIKSWEVER